MMETRICVNIARNRRTLSNHKTWIHRFLGRYLKTAKKPFDPEVMPFGEIWDSIEAPMNTFNDPVWLFDDSTAATANPLVRSN